MQFIDFIKNIPGLGVFLFASGVLMMTLDIKKLVSIAFAKTETRDFRFFYILPGITFFTVGFMLMMDKL